MTAQSPTDASDMPEPKPLRNLRLMVSVLMATMIIGIALIFFLIIYKFMQPAVPDITLPDTIEIPANETAQAITQGRTWIGVVTIDETGAERIHILNVDGSPRQVVDVQP